MKYFAILRDSFREAADSKVLYVLFGLAALVILFVSSLSFTPKKAEDTFREFTNGTIATALTEPDYTMRGHGFRSGSMNLVSVDVLKGEMDSPLAEYKLVVLYQGLKKNAQPFDRPHAQAEDAEKWEIQPKDHAKVRVDSPVDPAKEKAALAEKEKAAAEFRAKGKEDIYNSYFKKAEELGLIKVIKIEPQMRPDFQVGQGLEYTIIVEGTPRTHRLWANEMSLLFGAFDTGGSHMLGDMIYVMTDMVMWIGSLVAVLMAVIITSSFIPNMLRKGTVDLLLVKPIHRWALLFYKYIGGLTFIVLVTTFSVVGMTVALSVRSGLWPYQILLLIPIMAFFFSILYAFSTLVGVMTRSTIACILLTIAAWFFFFIVGYVNEKIQQQSTYQKANNVPEGERASDGAWGRTFSILHLLTPHTRDVDRLNGLVLYCSLTTGSVSDLERFNTGNSAWWESLLVSGIWIGIFLTISCLWFATKDY